MMDICESFCLKQQSRDSQDDYEVGNGRAICLEGYKLNLYPSKILNFIKILKRKRSIYEMWKTFNTKKQTFFGEKNLIHSQKKHINGIFHIQSI